MCFLDAALADAFCFTLKGGCCSVNPLMVLQRTAKVLSVERNKPRWFQSFEAEPTQYWTFLDNIDSIEWKSTDIFSFSLYPVQFIIENMSMQSICIWPGHFGYLINCFHSPLTSQWTTRRITMSCFNISMFGGYCWLMMGQEIM